MRFPYALRLLAFVGFLAGGVAGQAASINTANGGGGFYATNVALNLAGPFTVELWFKFLGPLTGPTYGFHQPILRRVPNSSSVVNYQFEIDGGDLVFTVGVGFYNYDVTYPLPIGLNGTWRHIAGVFDGTTATLYFDGVPVASDPVAGASVVGAGPLAVGANATTWTGLLDEIRFWNTARTATEIAEDRFVSLQFAPGLVASFRCDNSLTDVTSGIAGAWSAGPASYSTDVPPVLSTLLINPGSVKFGQHAIWELRAAPGAFYYFDVTTGGTAPGTVLSTNPLRVLPLNRPLLFLDVSPALPPDYLIDFLGVFPPEGRAFPRFDVPILPGAASVVLRSSFVVFDPATAEILQIAPSRNTILSQSGPTITSVSPASGSAAGGAVVNVYGSGFTGSTSVRFDGEPAPSVVFVNTGHLIATTPPGTPGPAHVGVRLASTAAAAFLPNGFEYAPALQASSVSPEAPVPGVPCVVAGGGFHSGTAVAIDGVPVATTVVSAEALSFVPPPNVACDATLALTNPDGQSVSLPFNRSAVVDFAYANAGPSGGGGVFVLLGYFPADCAVAVGGSPASVVGVGADFLLVAAPAGAPGLAAVVLTTPSGCATPAPDYLYL